MLWQYWLNSGFIEASDLASARRLLLEQIKNNPNAVLGRIVPTEPSCKNVIDVFKRALGAG